MNFDAFPFMQRNLLSVMPADPGGYLLKKRMYERWRQERQWSPGQQPPGEYMFIHQFPDHFREFKTEFELWFAVKRLTR